jgi:hypothetical protein
VWWHRRKENGEGSAEPGGTPANDRAGTKVE